MSAALDDRRIIVKCQKCGNISSCPLPIFSASKQCFEPSCGGWLVRLMENEQRIAQNLGQYEARFGFLPFEEGGL